MNIKLGAKDYSIIDKDKDKYGNQRLFHQSIKIKTRMGEEIFLNLTNCFFSASLIALIAISSYLIKFNDSS